MSKKYRIFCTETGFEGWKEFWSDTYPTTWPENPTFQVNPNSVQLTELSVELIRINNRATTRNSSFTRVLRFSYNPERVGIIRFARGILYSVEGIDSFDLQIYDVTNDNELLSVTNMVNTNEEIIMTLGELSNVPTTESIIEVNLKKNGGSFWDTVNLDEIIFYS